MKLCAFFLYSFTICTNTVLGDEVLLRRLKIKTYKNSGIPIPRRTSYNLPLPFGMNM